MFRKLIRNKKAQNTAEYAILISLVVAGIIAMQTYAQRALQARVRDAAAFMATTGNSLIGNTAQYEPYYLSSNYQVVSTQDETVKLTNTATGMDGIEQRTRGKGGFQESSYDTSQGLVNGI